MQYRLLFILSVLLLTGCMTGKDGPDKPGDDVYDNKDKVQLSTPNWEQVYRDTVTPPANPLVPPTSATVSIEGVLEYAYSVSGAVLHAPHARYALCREGEVVRFDEPMLQAFYLGDTLRVTGEILGADSCGYYYIQMNQVELIAPYNERGIY